MTELTREVPPDGLPGAYRSYLVFNRGKYFIYGGKYRRGGLGETEIPARAIERMLAKGELKKVAHLNTVDIYSLVLKTRKRLVKRKTD